MPERVNLIKLKAADQRFGLGYKPKKGDYKRRNQKREKDGKNIRERARG